MSITIGALAHEMAQRHGDTVNYAVHAIEVYARTIGVVQFDPALTPLAVELSDEQAEKIRAMYAPPRAS